MGFIGFTPPYLEVRKITGGWSMFPPDLTATDDLYIYANGTDTTPVISLLGGGALNLNTGGNYVYFQDAGTTYMGWAKSGATEIKLLGVLANADIFLSPNGSGVLKFGTYTAGAATDSTGYITIKDAAGNTRKLMVQA